MTEFRAGGSIKMEQTTVMFILGIILIGVGFNKNSIGWLLVGGCFVFAWFINHVCVVYGFL